MRDRLPPARKRLGVLACRIALRAVLLAAAGAIAGAIAGCGSSAGSAASPVACGTTRTAVNVPVHIQVVRGQVSCATALQVERDYAKAIQSGKVPGNGGGAPVQVQGWKCQGFSTPEMLKTGDASKCTQGSNEIMAVLPNPT